MRFVLLALVPFVSLACATARPFEGLDVVDRGYVQPVPGPEDLVREATEADHWVRDAERADRETAGPFLSAFDKLATDPARARQELYGLVRTNKARFFKNEIHRIFFAEAAGLAVVRLSFPSCDDQFAVNVLRDREGSDSQPGLFMAYGRAEAWLLARHHLGCRR